MKKSISINIPISLNILILKNKHSKYNLIYLYKNNYYFLFYAESLIYYVDIETYSIVLFRNQFIDSTFYEHNINLFLKTLESYFFIKIKFKGKGFKIKIFKKLKLIKFFFGRSHITFYKFKKIKIFRISKYKFILKNLNLSKLNLINRKITNIKPLNVFTQRGLRNSRQVVLKRKGKKGSYI